MKTEMHSASLPTPSTALQDPGPTIHSVIIEMGAKLFPVLPPPQDVSSLWFVDHHHRYLSSFSVSLAPLRRGWRIEHSAIISL